MSSTINQNGPRIKDHEPQIREILSLFQSAFEKNQGTIVLINGESGNGKSTLLNQVKSRATSLKASPIIIAGGILNGVWTPWDESRLPDSSVIELITKIFSFGKFTGEWLGGLISFLGMAIGTTVSATKVIQKELESFAKEKNKIPSDLFSKVESLFCKASAEQPLVCIIDNLDKSNNPIWNTFFFTLIHHINVDLPVSFLVTTTPRSNSPLFSEDDPTYNLFRFVNEGKAKEIFMHPATEEEVTKFLDGADPLLVKHLHKFGEGNLREIKLLWNEWSLRSLVFRNGKTNQWEFDSNKKNSILARADFHLMDRLRKIFPHEAMSKIEEARQMLSCGALEGITFTINAIAEIFHREPQDLADFLNRHLVYSENNPEGVLSIAGEKTIQNPLEGPIRLKFMKFLLDLHWETMKKYGLSPEKKQSLSLSLANILIRLYKPRQNTIASTLAQLFLAGEDEKNAKHYNKMATALKHKEAHLLMAKSVLQPKSWWGDQDFKYATETLLNAADNILGTYPHEVMEFLKSAQGMAKKTKNIEHSSKCSLLMGRLYFHRYEMEEAIKCLNEAIEMYKECEIPEGVHDSLIEWAKMELMRGDYGKAKAKFEELLTLLNPSDSKRRAQVFCGLAEINHRQGHLPLAKKQAEDSHNYFSQWGLRPDVFRTQYVLGQINMDMGDFDDALIHLSQAQEYLQEVQEQYSLAAVQFMIGKVYLLQGRLKEALNEYKLNLEGWKELNFPTEIGRVKNQIGFILIAGQDFKGAQENFCGSLEIFQKCGEKVEEGITFGGLATIAFRTGFKQQGIRLAVLSLSILESVGHREAQNSLYILNSGIHGEGHSQKDLEIWRLEVKEGYSQHQGWDWVQQCKKT